MSELLTAEGCLTTDALARLRTAEVGPTVTIRRRDFVRRWRWDCRCERHGTLTVYGDIDDWEPDIVTIFRAGHRGCMPAAEPEPEPTDDTEESESA